MRKTGLYDTLQIASNFMEQAEKLAKTQDFEAAFAMLEKAKSYAFDNAAMLDNIRLRSETLSNAQRHYIKQLEEEAAKLFNREPFDGQKAREVLQTLRQQDKQNEIAQSLWEELHSKEAAERERRLIEEVQEELEKVWQQADALARNGAGSQALAEYERAIVEASKKVSDAPTVIPLQRLKLIAIEKRDRAKEKWEGVPTLISAHQGTELIDYYEILKSQGETEAEFFDEQGLFVGYWPIDECIDQAKSMANHFAAEKAQAYLDQAHQLLAESPRAAYEKIQEALATIDPNDTTKRLLEQELKEKIRPVMVQREKALALLNMALSTEDSVESWLALDQVEQADRYTPGLADARQQLAAVLEQRLIQLLDKGAQFQNLEEFELAQGRFNEVVKIGQLVAAYSETMQKLYNQGQEALARCLQRQQAIQLFEQRLAGIAELSQAEPEQANEALVKLKSEAVSKQDLGKIERLQVQIDFRLGVDRLFLSLEQKMLAITDPVDLIPIEEGAKQACGDYPEEACFPRLVERIVARRAFLQAATLCEDPEQYVDALSLLQKVVKLQGDDASKAKNLLEKIASNEQQEADIAIALREATQALDKGDARSAFLLLQPFRYAASRQAAQVRDLISRATTHWRSDIEQQLEALVAAENFILPKVEYLIQELERTQSPRAAEWRQKALAPAYATTARDLQELGRWEEAELLWEEAFRLAPKVPHIIEGRRNTQKHNMLIRAQTATDPADKERYLTDLHRAYSNDPVIKRHLAAFYFSQKRHAEARLVLSQAKILLEQGAVSTSEVDAETIRHMEKRVLEAEEIEKRTSAIRNQIKGEPSLRQLKEARLAYEALLKDLPEQSDRLQRWWEKLIEVKINRLESELVGISDKVGTAWTRAELMGKILVLQADDQIQGQARRLLKLAYDQLQPEIKMVVENPEGVGFGSAEEALDNHMAKAKALYEHIVEMNQLELIMAELGLEVVEHEQNLNELLYTLELTMEKLYFIQEKRHELKNQLIVALVTGKWSTVDDNLQEFELKGWGQHRGVKNLRDEVEQAKQKRLDVETAMQQIKQGMAQEEFRLVQQRLADLLSYDPADETQLRANFEVIDPYTGHKIKGQQELEQLIAEKLTVVDKLNQWQAKGQPAANWPIVKSKILKLASQGDFQAAIELAQSTVGQNTNHAESSQNEIWPLEHLKQHLQTFPATPDMLNSHYAKNLFDLVNQKSQVLTKQINEGAALLEELQQKDQEVKQILTQLKPLLQRLNERRDFLSTLFSSSAESEEAKIRVRELVKRGRQLCPEYPGFANFDESLLLKR
jgi:hypothetical protein